MKLTIKKLSCMALLVAMTMMQTSCDELLGEADNPTPDDVKTAITLNESTLEMAYGNGKEVTLEATVSLSDAEYDDITWSSSDESVATVDDEGVVHAVGAGTAVITAEAGDKKATCDVSVVINLETPLTFEAAKAGVTVKFNKMSYDIVATNVEYSLDGGITWKDDLTSDGVTLAAAGDKISFRGTNETYGSDGYYHCYQFKLSNETYVYGNVMSLINKDNYPTNKTLTADYTFMGMFDGQTKLKNKDADHQIFLPATTLTENCYNSMFDGCKSLTTAPELPAKTLAKWCYNNMFWDCKGLTTAPKLPATTLAEGCYSSMFQGCENLTTAPELPATEMKKKCYSDMFYNCTNLTTAPKLPAETLAEGCYCRMFYGCTNLTTAPELPATEMKKECYFAMFTACKNLTTAPELPATTLAESCYYWMFYNCQKLSSVTCKATDLSADYCLFEWLYGAGTDESVTSKTIYISSSYSDYIADMNSNLEGTADDAQINTNVPWEKGNKGIPAGWTIAAAE